MKRLYFETAFVLLSVNGRTHQTMYQTNPKIEKKNSKNIWNYNNMYDAYGKQKIQYEKLYILQQQIALVIAFQNSSTKLWKGTGIMPLY